MNSKSRTTLNYTGKSWSLKPLTKREKEAGNNLGEGKKSKPKKQTKTALNKSRFELLIVKLNVVPTNDEWNMLFEKFNSLDFEKKQELRRAASRRRNKCSVAELLLKIERKINEV